MTVPGGANLSAGKANSGAGTVVLIVGVVSLASLVMCGGLLAALIIPAVQSERLAMQHMRSKNNLKQIMLALHNYHDAQGAFPPAYIADKDGRPKHSWRVLILPYFEEASIYNRYDMSQPWDSPQNLSLANTVPQVYRSPTDEKHAPKGNQTSYLLFVGENTLFDGRGERKIAEVTDGISNTIAICEVNNSGVIWTQPTDLDAAKLDFVIHAMNDQRPGQINSDMPGCALMAMFDGSVRAIRSHVTPETLRSATNPSDGAAVNLD
jgi:hypothetical protein